MRYHDFSRFLAPSQTLFAMLGVGGIFLFALPAQGNLILNGDFETGPFDTNGTIQDWVASINVANTEEGSTTPPPTAEPSPHAATLSAGQDSENDTLSQSFATVNGQVYTLTFDAGIYGQRTGDPLQLDIDVNGTTNLLHDTITPPDIGTFDPMAVDFDPYSYTFVGDGTTATLVFTSKELGNQFADQLVDSVVVDLAPALQLNSAVSQKLHNGTPFSIDLPLSGEPGVECRQGIPLGSQTLVFTFSNDVVSGSASVTTGTVGGVGTPVFVDNTMTVDLTGVDDAQLVVITLSGVTDSFGQVLPDTNVSMNVLVADTNHDKSVNSSDISETKARSGSPVDSVTCREDLNTDGLIDAADISTAKANSGNGLLENRSPAVKKSRVRLRPLLQRRHLLQN